MNIEIRPIREEEYATVIKLIKEFAHFEKRPDKMTNSLERMIEEKAYFHCFVAVVDGELAGYVSHFFAYYTWIGKSLYMDDLYVKPAFRGQGVGTQLLATIFDFARANQCRKVRWHVSDWNTKAQVLYKKIGAEITSGEWNCDLLLD